jgi:hypothetical protein
LFGSARQQELNLKDGTGESNLKGSHQKGESYQKGSQNKGQSYQKGPRQKGESYQKGPQNKGDSYQKGPQNKGESYQKGPQRKGELYQKGPQNKGELYQKGPYHLNDSTEERNITGQMDPTAQSHLQGVKGERNLKGQEDTTNQPLPNNHLNPNTIHSHHRLHKWTAVFTAGECLPAMEHEYVYLESSFAIETWLAVSTTTFTSMSEGIANDKVFEPPEYCFQNQPTVSFPVVLPPCEMRRFFCL